MKNNFYVTALKALKKQREVFQNHRDRYESEEITAKANKEKCESEILDIDKQIAETERKVGQAEGKQKELSLA